MTEQPAQPNQPAQPSPARPRSGSGEVADAVRAAVLAVPGVADLHSGSYGEVATYLPGRKVAGVRVRPERTEVHVVLDWGAPALTTADAVRGAATAITATAVDVHVQDFAAPPGFNPNPAEPDEPDDEQSGATTPQGDQDRDQTPTRAPAGEGLPFPVPDGPGWG